MKLIDKDAVVAEIEKRIKAIRKTFNEHSILSVVDRTYGVDRTYANAQSDAFKSLLPFLDTLEVKEVDLENYVHGIIDYPIIGSDFPNIYPNYKELKNYCDKNRIMDNDKVRLIIVKEDMP